MSRFFLPGDYSTQYPVEPRMDPSCGVNLYYETIPTGNFNNTHYIKLPKSARQTGQFPRARTREGQFGKHLLGVDQRTGEVTPNWYPYEHFNAPEGTMYESDLTRYDETGRYISSHFQLYPFTSREVREKNWYAFGCLPTPSIARWQRYNGVDSKECPNHS
jgi:hypothetical protein